MKTGRPLHRFNLSRPLVPASPMVRAALLLVLIGVYGLLTHWLRQQPTQIVTVGVVPTTLTLLLVVAAAALFGAPGGSLTAVALFCLNSLLVSPDLSPVVILQPLRVATYLSLTAIGAIVGRFIRINRRLRAAREQLAESEGRLRIIADYTSGWEDWIGTDGRLLWVSPAVEKATGYSVRECYAMEDYPSPIVHEEDGETAEADIRESLRKSLSGEGEVRGVCKDGSLRWFDVSWQPVFDGRGRHLGIRSSMSDITERKAAEQSLRHSEELYRSLFEQSADGIIIVCGGKIVLANTAFATLQGASNDQLVGSDPFELIHPEDRDLARSRAAKLISGEWTSGGHLYRGLRMNGDAIWVDVRSHGIRWNGQPALQTVVRDMTERKRLEDRLRTSLSEKEVLLQEIHHRVKNNMQMASSLLNMQAQRYSDERVRDALQLSRNRIQTLALVHENLYSSDSLADVDMTRHVERLVSYIRSAFRGGKCIDVETEIEGVALVIGFAIPVSLIVNELVTNSIKHAFGGRDTGTVRVRLRREGADGPVVLQVEDDGCGLPPDDELAEGGQRLGLTLVRTLATRQLGGEINVERIEGTRWTLRFGC